VHQAGFIYTKKKRMTEEVMIM